MLPIEFHFCSERTLQFETPKHIYTEAYLYIVENKHNIRRQEHTMNKKNIEDTARALLEEAPRVEKVARNLLDSR
jgi:hypothetical protein